MAGTPDLRFPQLVICDVADPSCSMSLNTFPQTHLSHGLGDGYAERGVAVQDGGADLEFGDLAVAVA